MHRRSSMVAFDGAVSRFDVPVSRWMVGPVHALQTSDRLTRAAQSMAEHGISAMPVLDDGSHPVGVLSRSDLVDAGRGDRARDGAPARVLSLPEGIVAERMTPMMVTAAPDTRMREVARHMVRQHIHRVYVAIERGPCGVVSTKEMMAAVADARIDLPIVEIAQPPLVVEGTNPLSLALDRMLGAHAHGILVVERGWPIGFLTQAGILRSRDAIATRPVKEWMDPRIICLPLSTPVFRAARQALEMGMRRVIAVDDEGIRGVASGMDFTRVVAFA